MGAQQNWSLDGAVESYVLWWHEAGFHTGIDDEAHDWHAPPTPFWRNGTPAAQPQAAVAAPAQPVSIAPVAKIAAAPKTSKMPDTLPAFLDWLAQDAGQPEAEWDSALILPPAQQDARLLLIVEMPSIDAIDNSSLLEAGQRRFLDAMVASLGLAPDEAALVAIATRRPPGGLLDEETLARMTIRMMHYLGLARPKSAIILGDRTSRALLGPQWSPRADELPLVKHHGGTMSAVGLASPELLMSRPMAKAKSWQALRLLRGNLEL